MGYCLVMNPARGRSVVSLAIVVCILLPTLPTVAHAEGSTAASEGSADTPADVPYDAFTIWHGVVREGGAYRRSAPISSAPVEEELDPGTPLRVDGWVSGSMLYPDVITWGAIDAADGGGYVFGGALKGTLPTAVPPPADVVLATPGYAVDVNLTLNLVTAYQDGQPLKMMLTSPGRPGYTTDTGIFSVRSKLTRQTMTGPGYSVPNVPNVQYFYGGEALHGRYWTLPAQVGATSVDIDENGIIQAVDDDAPPDGPNSGVAFGVPSSHGCLGLQVDDAAWLYSFTRPGMLVVVHY
jgi:lipoprotein-anchoring transpeptidase ErfK/SrfK